MGINILESPAGYYPVSKESVRQQVGENRNKNICISCDWRKGCDALICSCMSYRREDGMSVVFKKKPKNDLFEGIL